MIDTRFPRRRSLSLKIAEDSAVRAPAFAIDVFARRRHVAGSPSAVRIGISSSFVSRGRGERRR
ncbi:Hypothetical protein A7982_08373 [Minicystis rosea]|nr:Hypothetical protein A7982_08373 [Minicystis rosea]